MRMDRRELRSRSNAQTLSNQSQARKTSVDSG
jgi:hypothetical protein